MAVVTRLKLNSDQISELVEVLEHPGWKVYEKLLGDFARDLENELLRVDLKPGREVELAYAKARAEGAKKLILNVSSYLTKVRKNPN